MFDPRQRASMMKQMGIKTNNISAVRAIFEKSDGTSLVIDNPEVVEIIIQGKSSYQVSGTAKEVKRPDISDIVSGHQTATGTTTSQSQSDEDIEMVMHGAGVSRDIAMAALKKSNGDIAKAIIDLGGDSSK